MMAGSSPPPAIVGDVNDPAAQQSTWAFLLLWYITSWLGAGEVMSYRVSSFPPPHLLPLTSPLLWLEQLQNQLVVRCFQGIVWGRAAITKSSSLKCLQTQKQCMCQMFYWFYSISSCCFQMHINHGFIFEGICTIFAHFQTWSSSMKHRLSIISLVYECNIK